MLRGDGFGAHHLRHGHRLPRQLELGLGPTGLARRFGAAAMMDEAERQNRVRMVVGERCGEEDEPVGSPEPPRAAPSPPLPASHVDKKSNEGVGSRRGRPKTVEGEPWEAEGISRRTWERRRKGGGGSGL
jgi:hypothetical protein